MITTDINGTALSSAFYAATLAKGQTVKGRLLVDNGGESPAEWTQGKFSSFSIERSACVSGQFTLGSTVASKLSVSVLTDEYKAIIGSVDNVTIEAQIAYKIGSEWVWISLGTYRVDKSDTTDNGLFTSLVAYDKFMESEVPMPSAFFDVDFTEMTIAQVASRFNSYAPNLQFAAGISFPSTPMIIKLSSDMTEKAIAGRIAMACGTNAIMQRDNTYVTLVKPASTVTTSVTAANYQSMSLDPSNKTRVTYLTAPAGEETVYYPAEPTRDDEVGLAFDDSYLTATEAIDVRQQLATMLPSTIAYQGVDLTVFGVPQIEPMDLISAQALKDGTIEEGVWVPTVYYITPLTVTTTYNGGLTVNIKANTIDSTNDSTNSTTGSISTAVATLGERTIEIGARSNYYFTCQTGGAVTQKVVAADQTFVLLAGCTVNVRFTYSNTVANPTLRVGNVAGEAKPIYANNRPLRAVDIYNWKDGDIVAFRYDGEHWCIANANPASHMSFESGQGLKVFSEDETTYTNIGADSISFYVPVENTPMEVLKLSNDGLRIGLDPNSGYALPYVNITQTDMQMINGASNINISATNGMTLTAATGRDTTVATLSSSLFDTSQIKCVSTQFKTGVNTGFAWIARSNGHLSLKRVR